ncbi:lactate racemase domain-containing protein [Paenibacillus ehimensis]|uniref:Lactate racemase domain-containing protein n=1 Tax=Paenibacillus ehimensis TaxID=79264 RepID=A0ABT8V8D8_9BACL|nr:lactate racemase domain-containing protein [Paenibacillus ehimensis]MDO3677711.1 lactate racemase domain-containing protein [Paenibacillus ehimensis]MEC0209116.1 lactate racemase domain-containing protein [Paenibacillus ehimensis]
MSVLRTLLQDIPIPQMVRIRQKFDGTRLERPTEDLERELAKPGAIDRIKPGQQVAVAVGSRGVANIAAFTRTTIDAIKRAGAHPFIVPCMGSHGGATAEGQKEVLHHLGVTEEAMGVPIRSTMEVVQIDQLPNGLPVYVDKYAYEADAIVVINRVKPHTAFRGKIESGIMKMISIGLGKQKGAEACHQLGFKYMAENVPAMARIMLEKLPILFGVALVENAYDETCIVEVLPAAQVEEREMALLEIAKARLPKILFDQIDVLVIDYIGKNISGDGMDPNITGRYPTPYAHGGPDVSKMVVLDTTPETKGNANGVGTADFTTQRLVDKMDLAATYANGLTSTVCAPTKIATTLENDLYAIKAAVKTCNILDYTQCRLVRIRDTLHLGEIEISVNLLEEAKLHPDIEILTDPYDLPFNSEGNLV